MDDDESIKKNYNWYDVEYDKAGRKLKSFAVNVKKVANAKRASGFFAYVTLGLEYTPLMALEAYSLRDEQEKYFNDIPDECAPSYKSRKALDKRRGRPAKQKTEELDS